MDILNLKRGMGKSTYLVKRSHLTNIPILVPTGHHKIIILDIAKD